MSINTYFKTLEELKGKVSNADRLAQEKCNLQELYQKALETTKQYRDQLLDSATLSQEVTMLREFISSPKDDLTKQHKHILELDNTIKELREEYQRQQEEIARLQRENCTLRDHVEILKASHNFTMEPGGAG